MTQTSALKSPAITSADTYPVIPVSAGQGNKARTNRNEGFVTSLSADAIGSTYRLVRVPTTAIIKKVALTSAAATAGAGDIDLAWSDAALSGVIDGVNPGVAGGIIQINSADNKLFGAAQSLVGVTRTDITFAGSFVAKHLQMPLWAVLGVPGGLSGNTGWTDDPGGCFDLMVKLTTAITTGGLLMLEIEYTP